MPTVAPGDKLLAVGLCVWIPVVALCPGRFSIGLLLSGLEKERNSVVFVNGLIGAGFAGCTCTGFGLIVLTRAWALIPGLKCALLSDTADLPRTCPCAWDAVTEIESIVNILLIRTLLTTTGNLISTWL